MVNPRDFAGERSRRRKYFFVPVYLTICIGNSSGLVEGLYSTRLAEHVLGLHGVVAVGGQVVLTLHNSHALATPHH